LVSVAIAGIALNQNAFKSPLCPHLFRPSCSWSPLCGIGLSAGLFAQHIRLGAPYLAIEILSLAVMAIGVTLVARSPLVTGYEQGKAG
jgi:hypothetical protein